MHKYKYQKVLKIGSTPMYDREYSRLYVKLPVSWCKGKGIKKGTWLRITETPTKIVIEKEEEE